jgi:hypothetical protein
MARRKSEANLPVGAVPRRTVEHFSVPSQWLRQSQDLRLDARHFNPTLAQALETLRHSGLKLARLGDITEKVVIPNRFKRVYVDRDHGLPFLQGSHIVHFQPADIKYVSRTVHKNIEQWVIHEGWLLVTRSGTVGRVAMCPAEWDGWAASEHILRIIPNEAACPGGYLYSFLASSLGHVQLTAQIYGAVVDELTEEQTRGVLVPLPVTKAQQEAVNAIDRQTRESVAVRSRAVALLTQAGEETTALITADKQDISIARERLAEIEKRPETLVGGDDLAARLKALL